MPRPPGDYSGKNKTWWAEAEAIAWIVERNSSGVNRALRHSSTSTKAGRGGNANLYLVVRRAAMLPYLGPKQQKEYSPSAVLIAKKDLQRAAITGLLKMKEGRLLQIRRKKLWPALGGPGRRRAMVPTAYTVHRLRIHRLANHFMTRRRDKAAVEEAKKMLKSLGPRLKSRIRSLALQSAHNQLQMAQRFLS